MALEKEMLRMPGGVFLLNINRDAVFMGLIKNIIMRTVYEVLYVELPGFGYRVKNEIRQGTIRQECEGGTP